jgi:hypothetical protein
LFPSQKDPLYHLTRCEDIDKAVLAKVSAMQPPEDDDPTELANFLVDVMWELSQMLLKHPDAVAMVKSIALEDLPVSDFSQLDVTRLQKLVFALRKFAVLEEGSTSSRLLGPFYTFSLPVPWLCRVKAARFKASVELLSLWLQEKFGVLQNNFGC